MWGWIECIRRHLPDQIFQEKNTRMKKLLLITIGLGIALGTISFAQDTTDTTKKEGKKKKKKDGDTTTKAPQAPVR